jgi:VIT1/CCC1 family predicted Fe2+/Mn2+ transporter
VLCTDTAFRGLSAGNWRPAHIAFLRQLIEGPDEHELACHDSASAYRSIGQAFPGRDRTTRHETTQYCSPSCLERPVTFGRGDRIGWLRAAVLGANDGLISTSSLVVGVAAAEPDPAAILLAASSEAERTELAALYISRGLSPELAAQVADQLMAHEALGAHARDELGIHETTHARPIQAAAASATAFAVGAAPPTRGALRVAFSGSVAMGCTAVVGRLFGAVV